MKIVLANDSMLDIDCARGIQQSLPTLNKKKHTHLLTYCKR